MWNFEEVSSNVARDLKIGGERVLFVWRPINPTDSRGSRRDYPLKRPKDWHPKNRKGQKRGRGWKINFQRPPPSRHLSIPNCQWTISVIIGSCQFAPEFSMISMPYSYAAQRTLLRFKNYLSASIIKAYWLELLKEIIAQNYLRGCFWSIRWVIYIED